MRFHKTENGDFEILERLEESERSGFYFVHRFKFGAYCDFPSDLPSLAESQVDILEYTDKLPDQCKYIVSCAEALYTMLDELGKEWIEDSIRRLKEYVEIRGFTIYKEQVADQSNLEYRAARMFRMSGELDFEFEIVFENVRWVYIVSLAEVEIDNLYEFDYNVLGMISEFCVSVLFDMYKKDPRKLHLAKFADRKFSADLGL